MKYRLVSDNPQAKMDDIIINNALPLVIKGKSKNEIEKNISSLFVKGLFSFKRRIFEKFVV